MRDAALNLGGKLEVFWDDYLLEEKLPGICAFPRPDFRLEEPQKKEIVLRLDQSWEGQTCGYFHSFFDGRQFRFYYRASDGLKGPTIEKKSAICLLLSDDGKRWERPDLGLVEFAGSKKNNVVLYGEELDNFFVFRDENPDCPPAEQYKAISQGPASKEFPNGGLLAYVSPDGLSWVERPRRLGLEGGPTEGFFDSLNTVHWDREAGQYRLYFRGFHTGENNRRIRDIRLAVSRDFFHWENKGPLVYGAAWKNGNVADEQLYTNGILPYYRAPHIRLGFPVRYVERKWEPMFEQLPHREWRVEKMKRFNEPRLGTALTDGLFMLSRDGLNFRRHDEPFLRPGIFREDNWVYGDCYQGWGLLETGPDEPGAPDEISFFAGEDYASRPVGVRRYAIRPDGFACLYAGGSERQALTKPFIFSGNVLELNMSTSAGGFVTAEFFDGGGSPIAGYSGEAAYRMFGDGTAIKAIFWRGDGALCGLSPLEGKPVRIRFTLKEAKLYAMRFVKEEE